MGLATSQTTGAAPRTAPEMKRVHWEPGSHEARTEKFYGLGVENYGDFHGGYLNFGLWADGNDDYVAAAQNMVCQIARRTGLNERGAVLDVACGMGPETVFLQRRFGCQVDAMDVCWKHAVAAAGRVEKAGLAEQIRIHHGTAASLPFEDRTFTHVLSVEGPQHFNTRERFVQQAHRVLEPGGKLGVTDFVLNREPRSLTDRLIVEGAARLWHIPEANYADARQYEQLLVRNGFEGVSIEVVGKDVIPGYYREQHKWSTIRQVAKIRGPLAYPGHLIDYAAYKAFTSGLVEYVLVWAQKPAVK